ncbi:putative leucine-rich repeat-containing protein DDB_G0290503 [Musca vetustissima]|uniref:putative leucine-rich repeat-containing protein DDB_G0290503 n=1 Tax=Musca vetustissima TaxID=27455 RepID=UPI002AB6DA71|nr:putative leucine-rich repeat-containing protein DDB_G0290503 [Musca vetustissima]
MSDSDDTDILLLIPPDYYLANAEEKLIKEDLEALKRRQYASLQELNILENKSRPKISRDLTSHFEAMDLGNGKEDDALSMPPPSTSAAYQFLPPTRKAELNNINAKLHYLEQGEMAYADNPSDISSISTNTVKTQFGPSKHNREQVGMVHSTPKCMDVPYKQNIPSKKSSGVCEYKDDGVLLEIDNFLSNDRLPTTNSDNYWQQRHSDDYRARIQKQQPNMVEEQHQTQGNSLPTTMHTGSVEKIPTYDNHISKTENNLISLSEIWGKSGQSTAIATSSQSNLKEEQLRRQHLEKTVRQLQARLLEYQQRLSVAIEVDRTKDNALSNAQMENRSLTQELQQVRQNLQSYEQQRKQYDEKMEALQKELAQAVSLATKFQEKNERLEIEVTNYSRKTSESSSQYKQKMEELEIQVHACKRSEEMSLNELQKLRDKYAKSEHLYEKIKLRCDELEKENSTLRHQKEMLQEYHQKQKSRADNLENQRKSLQESLAHLTENECTLKKKLDLQQKSLKSHYQQQLENVVSQKLKEFQEQLDKTEENLRTEARERERLIAERAVKQLELINEKNELELKLLQEKQKEEVELYRIQLANATKKIEDLELKLSLYKSKRADIAEKLHNVMETQWQKALEILTSPNLTRLTQLDTTDNESPDGNETHNNAILLQNHQHNYETPKTSKKENNLNVPKNTSPPMDKLQAYIELVTKQ